MTRNGGDVVQYGGFVSATLFINEEQIPGRGEDSAMGIVRPNAAIAVSLDGCGGAGSEQYEGAGNATGARIAAEHAGSAVRAWFLQSGFGYYGTKGCTAEILSAGMKNAIRQEIMNVKERLDTGASGVESRMLKKFPTTLAAVLLEVISADRIRCVSFWAGDSRTYVFSTSGLQQTSRDDIIGEGDPFDSLMYDDNLSNCVSADGDFDIHFSERELAEPCMVITATDGCFSYYVSPLQFEWILLDTLSESKSPSDWKDRLREAVGRYAGDDYTMSVMVVGFQNWNAVRRAYSARKQELEKDYLEELSEALTTADREKHRTIWLRYKKKYMP